MIPGRGPANTGIANAADMSRPASFLSMLTFRVLSLTKGRLRTPEIGVRIVARLTGSFFLVARQGRHTMPYGVSFAPWRLSDHRNNPPALFCFDILMTKKCRSSLKNTVGHKVLAVLFHAGTDGLHFKQGCLFLCSKKFASCPDSAVIR
ncbi:hypothetical protein [Paludibacterium denitrificans]|nr:hypothetical protein [Paludibacterium denitrificans]